MKHELVEMVHKVGRVVDPFTGLKVEGTQFLEPFTDLADDLDKKMSLSDKIPEVDSSATSSTASSPDPQTP